MLTEVCFRCDFYKQSKQVMGCRAWCLLIDERAGVKQQQAAAINNSISITRTHFTLAYSTYIYIITKHANTRHQT
jgi:hypothetical protein